MADDADDHRHDWAALEQDWRAIIERSGWMVMAVPGGDDGPAFQYTVGLTERDLPEVIVYGLPQPTGHAILNDVARRIVDGARYADGDEVPELVEGDFRLELRDATWLQDPLGAAFRLYGEDAVRVRQLVVPDRENRMPWNPGFVDGHRQPVLFAHPAGVGPRPALPQPADGTNCDADVAGWDLPVAPHAAAIVTGPVADARLPVLVVVHESDGDWQFLDDVHPPDVEEARLLCLHHLVDDDPTLAEPVRDLEPGVRAVRDAVGAPWHYEYADDGEDAV